MPALSHLTEQALHRAGHDAHRKPNYASQQWRRVLAPEAHRTPGRRAVIRASTDRSAARFAPIDSRPGCIFMHHQTWDECPLLHDMRVMFIGSWQADRPVLRLLAREACRARSARHARSCRSGAGGSAGLPADQYPRGRLRGTRRRMVAECDRFGRGHGGMMTRLGVYNPVRGRTCGRCVLPGGAPGGRTLNQWVKSSLAQSSERTACTDPAGPCRNGTHFTWFHK